MESPQIMIVEDEAVIRAEIASHLVDLSYGICGAVSTGEQALDLLETQRPDLILMDITLAGDLDGIETTQKINENYECPVIYLTGHSDEATWKRALKTRHQGYLLKPFQHTEIKAVIERVLDRWKAISK